MKFVVLVFCGLLALAAGCVTPQQVREKRISKEQPLFSTFPADVQEKIQKGQIDLGYNPDMVRLALGDPQRKYLRLNKTGTSSFWLYTAVDSMTEWQPVMVPVTYVDAKGRPEGSYQTVMVQRDVANEYPLTSVEFREGKVDGIIQIDPEHDSGQ